MDNYQSYDRIYYVYEHIDPYTNEIRYIGHGCKSRAWIMGTSLESVGKYGHRKPDHQQWLEDLTYSGYTPADWVNIVSCELTKSEACQLEQELIREESPMFNLPLGQKLLKLSKEQVEFAKTLKYDDCLSYVDIGKELEVSAMTVWRAIKGVNVNEPK